ncbi:MAG: phosphatidate cytidylyltransferase [Fimbriiglobus sp.]|jgi:phosphatidate cytidylyltransferase|nr:phosphatidate cytidylyltransferase [Fimbriiglobus sp.]
MLTKRLIAGSLMAAGIGAILYGDAVISNRIGLALYPFLFVFTLTAGYLATRELVSIIVEPSRPLRWVCVIGVELLLGCHFLLAALSAAPGYSDDSPQSWRLPAYVVGGFVLFTFAVEMYRYRATGHSLTKIAHSLLVIAYLGILPSFFLKLRWLTFPGRPDASGLMLALAIFVPKCCDIAAYFVGRFLGRVKATPLLSPKKTWAGFIGGFFGAAAASLILMFIGRAQGVEVFAFGWVESVLFGVTLGFAGILGDLAESLIKRDGNAKDSAQTVPGFGGLLDVFDSVLFAGPVAYLWFNGQHWLAGRLG